MDEAEDLVLGPETLLQTCTPQQTDYLWGCAVPWDRQVMNL